MSRSPAPPEDSHPALAEAGGGDSASVAHRTERLVAYFESLTLRSLAELGEHYAEDASFRDPFNDVRGLSAIRAVFERMFERCIEPRFIVRERFLREDAAVLVWDFEFRVRAWQPETLRTIHGLSVVRFGAHGLVAAHRDYWDAAEELYEKLPALGVVLRALKRRIA